MGPHPESMRVAVYQGDQQVVVEDRPVPEPGRGEVVLEVSHCGVCGSDVHLVLEGWGQPGPVGGHEFTGTVVATGKGVTRWRIGDAVVGGPSPRCGRCDYCLSGSPSLCVERGAVGESSSSGGAFAEFVLLGEHELIRLPDGMSIREGALAEPLAVALHGVTRSRASPGERVLVTGGGPIGALTIAVLVHRGSSDVVLSEPSAARRELGEALGARAVRPDDLEVPQSPNELVEEPFDVAIECSGHASAMEQALAQLKRTGRLVFVGAGMKRPRIDSIRILLNELTVTGAFCYDPGGFDAALELLSSPDFPRELLIEADDVALEDIHETIRLLGTGEVPAKVLVAPGAKPRTAAKDTGR